MAVLSANQVQVSIQVCVPGQPSKPRAGESQSITFLLMVATVTPEEGRASFRTPSQATTQKRRLNCEASPRQWGHCCTKDRNKTNIPHRIRAQATPTSASMLKGFETFLHVSSWLFLFLLHVFFHYTGKGGPSAKFPGIKAI